VGYLRENAVALGQVLYGFAPLSLMLGRAPLIATIIWGYSIYLALVWGEEVTDQSLAQEHFPLHLLLASGVFMMALAGFYEPLLELVQMARWEEGTRKVLGVPWIALVGYPTLAVSYLLLHRWAAKRSDRTLTRVAWLGVGIVALAFGHAWGLKDLKVALGW
jgi:hypothetical protein